MMNVVKHRSPTVAWIGHACLLLVTGSWIALDPAFDALGQTLVTDGVEASRMINSLIAHFGLVRSLLLAITSAVVSFALLATMLAMVHRSPRHRRFRSLRAAFGLTTVIAFWCAICLNVSSISWQGKRIRLAAQLRQLESITHPLRKAWPTEDGEHVLLGPFMAYPFGQPQTLLLLQPHGVTTSRLLISAVERADSGAIRLQLGGIRLLDWVEWHPAGSKPQSFIGGLNESYVLQDSVTLGKGWHLVRYQS